MQSRPARTKIPDATPSRVGISAASNIISKINRCGLVNKLLIYWIRNHFITSCRSIFFPKREHILNKYSIMLSLQLHAFGNGIEVLTFSTKHPLCGPGV